MCSKSGEIVECKICYNPQTRKHLGLGKVVFQSERSARDCCSSYNQKTKMGNVMTVFLDTMGRERAKMIDSLCNNNSFLPLSSIKLIPATPPQQQNKTFNTVNNLSPATVLLRNNSQGFPVASSSAVGSSSSPSSSAPNILTNDWVFFN